MTSGAAAQIQSFRARRSVRADPTPGVYFLPRRAYSSRGVAHSAASAAFSPINSTKGRPSKSCDVGTIAPSLLRLVSAQGFVTRKSRWRESFKFLCSATSQFGGDKLSGDLRMFSSDDLRPLDTCAFAIRRGGSMTDHPLRDRHPHDGIPTAPRTRSPTPRMPSARWHSPRITISWRIRPTLRAARKS